MQNQIILNMIYDKNDYLYILLEIYHDHIFDKLVAMDEHLYVIFNIFFSKHIHHRLFIYLIILFIFHNNFDENLYYIYHNRSLYYIVHFLYKNILYNLFKKMYYLIFDLGLYFNLDLDLYWDLHLDLEFKLCLYLNLNQFFYLIILIIIVANFIL